MEKKIKVGIVGVGGIAQEHIEAYLHNPNVELYAFCDTSDVSLRTTGDKYGVQRQYRSVGEMLAALPELDAVSVCTWNCAHAECAIAALEAGCHVLCEKPMAMNAVQAKAMREAAERSGKLLMIGLVRRFGNDCEVLKDFIDSGFLGDIYFAKASYLRRCGNPGGWFGDSARSGGGPLIDLGVHIIDLVRYLMGGPKPVSVYGVTFRKIGERNRALKAGLGGYVSVGKSDADVSDVEDLAAAMIRFDNGAVLSVETSFDLDIKKGENAIQLFGTKAGARLDPELELFTEMNGYLANVQLANKTALSFSGLFQKEIDHFISCILDGVPCRAPAEDGVTLMEILDAIYRSAATGHEVMLGGEDQ